jgi:membrane protease YdiL (CAAX protease family)
MAKRIESTISALQRSLTPVHDDSMQSTVPMKQSHSLPEDVLTQISDIDRQEQQVKGITTELMGLSKTSTDYADVLMYDAGRALACVFSSVDPYVLVKARYKCQLGKEYDSYEQLHNELSGYQQSINAFSEAISARKNALYAHLCDTEHGRPPTKSKQTSGLLNHILYAIYRVLALRLPLYAYVNHWLSLPIILGLSAFTLYYVSGLIAVVYGGGLGASVLGVIYRAMLFSNLEWTLRFMSSIRMISLFFSRFSGNFDWAQFKYALSPDRFDWSKAVLGFVVDFGMKVLIFYPYFLVYGAPNFGWPWLVSALISVVWLGVQTLTEEVEFRRSAVERHQGVLAKSINLIIMPVLFAFGHFRNPELAVYNGNFWAKIAAVSNYAIPGFAWALIASFSGGLEFTWGMHFANNLFLAVMIGFYPSVIVSIPLLVVSAPWSSTKTAPFSHVKTAGQAAMVWLNAVVSALKSVVVPYFALLSQRTLYAPEPAQQYVTVDDLREKHRRLSTSSKPEQCLAGSKNASRTDHSSLFSSMHQIVSKVAQSLDLFRPALLVSR